MVQKGQRRTMTLMWSCPRHTGHLLFLIRNDVRRARRNIAASGEVFPEPRSPQPGTTRGGISSSVCSAVQTGHGELSVNHGSSPCRSCMSVGFHVEPWVGPVLKSLAPRTQGPAPIGRTLRGSVRPLCSTWNPSPGLPRQSGRAPSTLDGPRCRGKNSMTEDLLACRECAGFATAPHADAPHFGSALSGCSRCAVRRDGVRPKKPSGHRCAGVQPVGCGSGPLQRRASKATRRRVARR
jgi:hypothetical protein